MTSETLSILCGGPGPILPPGPTSRYTGIDNISNSRTPCQCLHDAYLDAFSLPAIVPKILIFLHDDLDIYDPDWHAKVLALFSSNPACAVVGLGGGSSLGRESLYKRPYRISDLARGGYVSNQRDWQVHGGHLDGTQRVAVVDAFFMAVRTDFLLECDGFPVDRLSHHCIDLWLACEAARKNKEVWAIGIDCLHHGGGTSTKKVYGEAQWLQGKTLVGDHEAPHKWLHEEYGDVLPIKVK